MEHAPPEPARARQAATGPLDAAIIGASAAGLFAAEHLARAGWRVGVFERQPTLDPARRTLIITPQLQHVLGSLPQAALLHHSRIMTVETVQARLRLEFAQPDWIVERSALTRLLAERARSAGATIAYGQRFRWLEPHPEGCLLQFAPGPLLNGQAGAEGLTVVARAVIGADGARSTVAAAAGLAQPPVVPIIQAEVALPPGWDPHETRTWFDADETRFFYWLIPEGNGHGVAGLVGDGRAETHALLQRFLERQGLQPLRYQAAQVTLYQPRLRPWTRVGSAPVLLVGDAAGQVKVTTVGGTVSGLAGAAAAARALVHGTPYAHELRPLQRELDLHWVIRLLLDRLDNPGYTTLVDYITPAIQQVLARRNRDVLAGGFWQILLFQPRLALLGLRLLLQLPRARPVSGGSLLRKL